MKRIVATLVFLIALLASCDNLFQEDDDEDTGTPPRILDAGIYPPGDWTSQRLTTIAIGTTIEVFAIVEDPEKDATAIVVEETGPDDYYLEATIELASQIDVQTLYSLGGPMEMEGPVGGYMTTLTPKDAQGNVGAEFRIGYNVTE